MMKSIIVCCLLFALSSTVFAQYSREEKLEQLKSRTDIKVTEIEKDILKIEYPHGKVIYKNIGDYEYPASSIPHSGGQQPGYSPTFDSTIIDLTTIDTTLYYQKYSFWQEVPLHNWEFDFLRIGDVNKNGRIELYGPRKFFHSGYEPVTVYELNNSGIFEEVFQYDTVARVRNIFDVNNNGHSEVHSTSSGWIPIPRQQRFYSKVQDTSLATLPTIIFSPFTEYPQLDDQMLGDFDDDGITDLIFDRASHEGVYIYEFNPITNNFDSVYVFEIPEPAPLSKGGFSIGDFDLDNKTDIVFGTARGNVHVIENVGNNQYTNSWQGTIESYHAYEHTWTKDIDRNGKPEFWVLGDAFYNGVAVTRITIFETNGNDSYHVVGRIDLIGVFSFDAGNMQAVDIDNDGVEEVAVCIDGNFLILKFNGSVNHHTYEIYYIKKNELNAPNEWQTYFGAIMYDLQSDGTPEILLSMAHTNYTQPNIISRGVTKIYRPDSTMIVNGDLIILSDIKLYQNYPNPFNPSTSIRFEINQLSKVSVKIYNILGKEIKALLENELSPGSYAIDWEAKDNNGKLLPTGVYMIRLSVTQKAGIYTRTIKALFLK